VSKHKDVLTPQDDYDDDVPLETPQKAIMVVERATGFATVASQLKALHDQQIPATDGFTKLAMLRPRIAEVEERHLQQALKISELRRRNGLVNQCYKQIHIFGAARVWINYNKRLKLKLRDLAREEYKRKPEEERDPREGRMVHADEDDDDEDDDEDEDEEDDEEL
jgi:hypothetical protein